MVIGMIPGRTVRAAVASRRAPAAPSSWRERARRAARPVEVAKPAWPPPPPLARDMAAQVDVKKRMEWFETCRRARSEVPGRPSRLDGAADGRRGLRGTPAGSGGGSSRQPAIAAAEAGAQVGDAPTDPPAPGLIGQGITFDTGEISIKPARSIEPEENRHGGRWGVVIRRRCGDRRARRRRCGVTGLVTAAENQVSGWVGVTGQVTRAAYDGKRIRWVNNRRRDGWVEDALGLRGKTEKATDMIVDEAT